jgi:CheY-specific phosphatase CheX
VSAPVTPLDLEALAAKAVIDVLKTQFKIDHLQHGEEVAVAEAAASLAGLPVARMLLHGKGVEGSVSVRIGGVLAARMLETMVGQAVPPEELDAALEDLARELCNMLAGRFSAYLAEMGHSVEISIPESSAGLAPAIEDALPVEGSAYHGFWWCDVQPLEVRFDLRTIS